MLKIALSFLFGITPIIWLPFVKIYWLFPLFVCGVIALFLSQRSPKKYHYYSIISFVLGFSYAIVAVENAQSHLLTFVPDNMYWVEGEITNLPKITDKKATFALDVDKQSDELKLKKILVNWYDSSDNLQTGQKWKLKLKLKPIHGVRNPGSFDYSKWLFRNGYSATASVKDSQLLTNSTLGLFSKINRLRENVAHFIDDHFISLRVKSLLKALVIGDKREISYKDSQLFQQTGAAHLIAISGLHIGLVAFFGLIIGRLIFYLIPSEHVNQFKYEAFFAILLGLFYALMAGLSIPTIRALVMVAVFSLAHVFKTKITNWQAWASALVIVLIMDPLSVLDLGFWFSFMAVAVLMFGFSNRKQSLLKVTVFIKAQIFILVGLLPLMAIFFHQINLLAPLTNFIVLPLVSFLLIPLLFLSLMVSIFNNFLSSIMFSSVEILVEVFFKLLEDLSRLNGLILPLPQLTFSQILVLVSIVMLLLLPKLFRWRFIIIIFLVGFLFIPAPKLMVDDFDVNLLDVGQGLSIVITTKNHTMVFDTGARYDSGYSYAASVVVPFLNSKAINYVDYLVLSHKDNDHAGGAGMLIEKYTNVNILDVLGVNGSCKSPKTWQWDGVNFSVLSPFELTPYLGNNSSCVIKISSPNGSVLLTADIEEPVEYRLVNNDPNSLKSDVLIVPHHGSKSSSSDDFLTLVNPKVALNSSGFANQFNHPHPKIKKRYKSKNITFLDTQKSGMITVKFRKEEIQFYEERMDFMHVWDFYDLSKPDTKHLR